MNTLNSIGAFLKRLRSGATLDPVRDWLILLSLSIIAFTGIVVWNIWAFDTIAAGGTIGTPATKAPAVFDNSSLDTIHAIFTSRATEEMKYESDAYHYTDPSQ